MMCCYERKAHCEKVRHQSRVKPKGDHMKTLLQAWLPGMSGHSRYYYPISSRGNQLIWNLSCSSFGVLMNKASVNSCILIAGHDDLLLRTRKWMLGKLYPVELGSDVAAVSALAASHSFRLVILCHTVTPEECREMADLLSRRSPGVKFLNLIEIADEGGTLECNSCTPTNRPEILLAKVRELLESVVDISSVN